MVIFITKILFKKICELAKHGVGQTWLAKRGVGQTWLAKRGVGQTWLTKRGLAKRGWRNVSWPNDPVSSFSHFPLDQSSENKV